MALVGDDHIEGMNWNVQLLGIVVYGFVTDVEDRIAAKEINCHPLDRADIDKRIALLGIDEIRLRQCLRIRLLSFVEILTLETLAIDFVNLVKLQTGLWLKRSKGADCLCC